RLPLLRPGCDEQLSALRATRVARWASRGCPGLSAADGGDRDDPAAFVVLDLAHSRWPLDLEDRDRGGNDVAVAVECDGADDVVRQPSGEELARDGASGAVRARDRG